MAQCDFESAELLMNGFDTLPHALRGRHHGQPRALCRLREEQYRRGDGSQPDHRLQEFDQDRYEALATGRGVYDLVLEHGILSKEELDTILKPRRI